MNDTWERAEDLLARRATEGITPAETLELEKFFSAHPGVDKEGFDLAAAALQLATLEIEPLPAHLAGRIEAAAARAEVIPMRRRILPAWIPVAAVLAFVLLGWLALRPAETPSPIDQRETLLALADDVRTLEWKATGDPAASGATGDVVWSDDEQKGFMRFRGLAANDPSVEQYQLWVFDAERDDRYPVDGGVFDIPPGVEEVVVPIDAKILVNQATLFAVTVEKPGGVVVSDRERIVVLAGS